MTIELTKEEKIKLGTDCYRSPVLFCKTFLPDWFSKPMPWVHRGILAILTRKTAFLLDFGKETWPDGECEWNQKGLDKIIKHFVWKTDPTDPNSPERPLFEQTESGIKLLVTDYTLILMPRGFSKTTLLNAVNIYNTCYKDIDFLLFISEASPHAEAQLDNVKNKLLTPKIKLVFGDLVGDKWRQDYAETSNGVKLTARGRNGQIRGLLRDGKRPNFILCDDLEDDESVKTEEQRSKAIKWLMRTVLPVLPRVGQRGRFVMLATALHAEAAVMKLRRDPSFVSIVFQAIDRDGEPLWEDALSLEDISAKKAQYILQGDLAGFYLEYFNEIRNDESALFTTELFRYEVLSRTDFTGVALAVDPAIGDDRKSDDSVYTVVGITDKGRMHVLDVWGDKGVRPDAQVDKVFELVSVWNPTVVGIESNAYQKALVYSVRDAQFRYSMKMGQSAYFAVTPIPNKRAKAERIKGILVRRFRAGYITLQRKFLKLETQLLDYPSNHDDYPDALAMAIILLDPMAGLAFDPDEYDKAFPNSIDLELGEWRSAP